jgi:hypothetical protein
MISEKEIEQKANDALKSLQDKVNAFNVKVNDGSKQSKAMIWTIAIVVGTFIAYCKHN